MRRCAYISVAILLVLAAGVQSFKRVGADSVTSTLAGGFSTVQETVSNAVDQGTIFAKNSARPTQGAEFEVEFSTNSDLEWNKTYGGASDDEPWALIQTADGGYALAGSTYSSGAGGSDAWLVKTDESGNMLWNKTYGGTGTDIAYSMTQTGDGGYALAGCTYSLGAGLSDFWLIKTDDNGDALWNKTYGGASYDSAMSLIQTVDGGYALAGNTFSFGAGNYDAWLVKTDESGDMLWNKTYGGTNGDGFRSVVQTGDGGYAMTGSTVSFGGGLKSDFWLIKTGADGNAQWIKTYGGTDWDDAYSIVQTGDAGYALVGCSFSFGTGAGDVWFVKTDAGGNHLWNKTYGGTSEDRSYCVVQTVDGGYALTGYTYSFGAGDSDVWLVKTSVDGSVRWNQTYGGTGEDYARSMVQTDDGGYALAGTTASFDSGSTDFWLLKTVREASSIVVPDDFSSIQKAINNAADGDTVFVKAGTYYEHVVVNKTVSLVGEDVDTTIIDGNGIGHVISIISDYVNVSGFTVQKSGNVQDVEGDAGFYLNNSTGCTISENRAINNDFCAVSLLYSHQNTITYNNLSGTGWYGIHLFSSNENLVCGNIIVDKYGGINGHVSSCYNNIMENSISNCTYGMFYNTASHNNISRNNLFDIAVEGIQLQEAASFNIVVENSVINCSVGIKLIGPSCNNSICGNSLADCQSGIRIQNVRYTEINSNTIAHNYGSDEWDAGIRLESADYTVIRDNEVFDNWRGVVLYASSPYVSICENNVTNNGYGVRVAMGGSNYVNISGNYVANNRGYGIDVTGFGGLGESNYATIARNLIVNNTYEAVGLGTGSSFNTVVQNDMVGNGHAGVTLERYSHNNTVAQNNIIGNAYGICFDLYVVNSTQNKIINNNIINNTQQVRIAPGSVNAWNGSYALGGNYWSDYSGSDQFSGPYQNLTSSDGIGDTPFVIDGNNIDHYPLMAPWTERPSLIGDVNGDGRVDMKDVGYVARRFMCVPGDPLWDANADLNSDEKINMVDIGTVARHFGEIQ